MTKYRVAKPVLLRIVYDGSREYDNRFKVQEKGRWWGWNDVGSYSGYSGDFYTDWYLTFERAEERLHEYCSAIHTSEIRRNLHPIVLLTKEC